MKHQCLHAVNEGQVDFLEREVGDPKPGEAQVLTHSTLISPGSERAFILGLENARLPYPIPIGYCGAGIVERVGEGVTKLAPGDRVAGIIGHAACVNTRENSLVKLPESVAFDQGAFLPLGVIAIQGVRKVQLELGESALVLGLGVIGLLAVQAARIQGALPLIGVDRAGVRLEMAKSLGADIALDASTGDWKEKACEACDGAGPHAVIEATGSPEAVPDAFQAARRFGRVSLLGCPRGISTVNFYRDLHHKGLTVVGAHISANPDAGSRPGFWTWLDDAAAFLRYVEAGRFEIDPLITGRVEVGGAKQAYEELVSWSPTAVGAVIRWD